MTDLTSLCTLLVSVPGLRCGVTSCQGIGSARTDVCTSKDSDSHASIQGEANEAVSWTDDMDEDAFLLLVAAAQNQGALGPAAALYIAAVAAASVAALRCSLRISSRGQQGTAAALRRAAVWLAEVSVDALVPEPAARSVYRPLPWASPGILGGRVLGILRSKG
ncbi:hypothetical protein Vretimale_12825, partial [Volvox reticuliferus]